MNEQLLPARATLRDAAMRIRRLRPIRGMTATNEDCEVRSDLIDTELLARGIRPGPRSWHTAQLGDGHTTGVWARSAAEAELKITVWWGHGCYWVVPDTDLGVMNEYFPHGVRSSREADRRFPLAPPRSPRDRFASTDSLLDVLGSPSDWAAASAAGPSR